VEIKPVINRQEKIQLAEKRETLSARVQRLEEGQIRLQNAMAHLAEVQARGEEDIRDMKREALEREKRIDERIEKLVVAIGELISHMPPIPPKAS
jgi:predicted  nucleic acid-binding Zn-ribbon protein